MKNEKGITLVSLITYVIGMIVIMIIIASALSFYNKNMAGINNASDANLEFNKFNNRMIQETKEKGNKIEDVTKTTIKFSNGNVYTFADNKIYLGKVQISKYVKEFSAKLETEGEKQLLKVYILVGKGNEELAQNLSYTIEYVTNKAEGGLTQVGKLEKPKGVPWTGEIANSFAGGTGTETDPYIIETPEQLAYLASTTNWGTSHEGEYFKITSDLDLGGQQLANGTWSGQEWTPIGSNQYFNGNLDGGNCEISNIYINSSDGCVGLFGAVENSSVSRINIISGYVNGSIVGSIVGLTSGTTNISNCKSSATVVGTNYVGGIIGESYTTLLSVRNCEFSGNVNGTSYAAGILAYGWSDISNCSNSGTIVGGCAGAILGWSMASNVTTLESTCTNTGTVNGSSSGPLVGETM